MDSKHCVILYLSRTIKYRLWLVCLYTCVNFFTFPNVNITRILSKTPSLVLSWWIRIADTKFLRAEVAQSFPDACKNECNSGWQRSLSSLTHQWHGLLSEDLLRVIYLMINYFTGFPSTYQKNYWILNSEVLFDSISTFFV